MKTDGIILKRKFLSDKLVHLTVLTLKLGKINLLYKPELKNFPLSVEPFSISTFTLKIFGEKIEAENIQLLKPNFPENFKRFKYLSLLSFYLDKGVLAPNRRIYELALHYFDIRDRFLLAATMFLIKLSFFEGIFPVIDRCVSCGFSEVYKFSIEKGGTVCKRCESSGDIDWNRKISQQVEIMLKKPFKSVASPNISRLKKIKTVFENHLFYRVEDGKSVRR